MNAISGISNQNALGSILSGGFNSGVGLGGNPLGALGGLGGASSNFNSNASALGMVLLQSLFQPMQSLLSGWQGVGAGNLGGLGGSNIGNASAQSSLAQIGMLFQMIQQYCASMQPQHSYNQNYSQAMAYQPQQQNYVHQEQPMMEQPHAEVALAVAEAAPAEVQVAAAVGGDGGGDGGGAGGGDGGDGGGSPVILDLNGDGKLDVGGKGGPKINFDLFGNGNITGTEWLKEGTEDGLLVADFDGNGQIDSGRELMRNTGVNGEQFKYKNGWDKVRQLFDTNKDGKVAGDELSKMSVWVDKNADGKTDPGELQSLASRGVSEIELPPGMELGSNFTMNGRRQLAYDYIFDLAPPTR